MTMDEHSRLTRAVDVLEKANIYIVSSYDIINRFLFITNAPYIAMVNVESGGYHFIPNTLFVFSIPLFGAAPSPITSLADAHCAAGEVGALKYA